MSNCRYLGIHAHGRDVGNTFARSFDTATSFYQAFRGSCCPETCTQCTDAPVARKVKMNLVEEDVDKIGKPVLLKPPHSLYRGLVSGRITMRSRFLLCVLNVAT